jgi:hypothetical protein
VRVRSSGSASEAPERNLAGVWKQRFQRPDKVHHRWARLWVFGEAGLYNRRDRLHRPRPEWGGREGQLWVGNGSSSVVDVKRQPTFHCLV